MTPLSPAITSSIDKINDLITTDAGGRGMKNLVVPGDLLAAAEILARLKPIPSRESGLKPRVIILTGFPCCVDHTPPMETDGLASVAIANAVVRLGYDAILVTEECNAPVFRAAVAGVEELSKIQLDFFPSAGGPSSSTSPWTDENDERLNQLAKSADLVIACERAGHAADGYCYTMRGINMNEKGLIAPLHRIVTHHGTKFIAIGDGGNEMGMGKVIDKIHEHIPDGRKIGAVVGADHLIAASVSNWGGYALIAAAALVRCNDDGDNDGTASGHDTTDGRRKWVDECLPTEAAETELLHRCVAAGCRDGVSGKTEATVDGMPLERSMECLREIRSAALGG
ncbi:hypothetical protein ACHAXR_004725 [Thalassiosira sp. AJA248-18]